MLLELFLRVRITKSANFIQLRAILTCKNSPTTSIDRRLTVDIIIHVGYILFQLMGLTQHTRRIASSNSRRRKRELLSSKISHFGRVLLW